MTPLQKRIERARFNVLALFQVRRILGLAVTAVIFYVVVFVVFGKTDVSWMLPKVVKHFQWPSLPQFLVWTDKTPDGHDETVYTVPARQLTKAEMAQLTATNAAPTAPAPQ